MRCPKCGKAHTRVVDSRMQESNNTIKRRRIVAFVLYLQN